MTSPCSRSGEMFALVWLTGEPGSVNLKCDPQWALRAQRRPRRGHPARGLHGEAYRGHIFWDDAFVFPYLDLRMPESCRGRCCSTGGGDCCRPARSAAGAMFPWQVLARCSTGAPDGMAAGR